MKKLLVVQIIAIFIVTGGCFTGSVGSPMPLDDLGGDTRSVDGGNNPGDTASNPGDTNSNPGDTNSDPGDTNPPPYQISAAASLPAVSGSLSETYPNDTNISNDASVLFHDDFEGGWGKWDWPNNDTTYLFLETDATNANGGSKFMRSTVTGDHLLDNQYISSSTRFTFPQRVDTMYFRFYAGFVGIAPNPHHWVRVSAGDAGYGSSGLANTRPPGDAGFWYDFDISNDDIFNFYAYWYKMHSGWCEDGTEIAGCDGQQDGNPYRYGNTFRPLGQTGFVRDQWLCIEMMGKTNTIGTSDGELEFWINNQPVGSFKPGTPDGTWFRDKFHIDGCTFSGCAAPTPFEGFDFRSDSAVRFKRIYLDAYYQRNTFENKKANLEGRGLTVSETQTIFYDDVVVATKRIGCKVAQ